MGGGQANLLRYYMGGGQANLLQYYMGGGVCRDPQIVLRNIWTAPYGVNLCYGVSPC